MVCFRVSEVVLITEGQWFHCTYPHVSVVCFVLQKVTYVVVAQIPRDVEKLHVKKKGTLSLTHSLTCTHCTHAHSHHLPPPQHFISPSQISSTLHLPLPDALNASSLLLSTSTTWKACYWMTLMHFLQIS